MAVNEDVNVGVDLSIPTKKLINTNDTLLVDLDQVYLDELDSSNKYRAIFTIKPVCSNVLYNALTEVVSNEGAPECFLLGDNGVSLDALSTEKVTRIQAIRDTEYSHPKLGNLSYHPGIDIFNNHILRNNAFTNVNPRGERAETSEKVYTLADDESTFIEKETVDPFNTIRDFKRDFNGGQVISKFPTSGLTYLQTYTLPKHLYEERTIDSFEKTINEKVFEDNGWIGFYNRANLRTFFQKTTDGETEEILINKVINSAGVGDFIDLFPDRTRFSFVPHINTKQHNRKELNWHCFLTYPYKNDETHPIVYGKDDLGNGINGLPFKVLMTYTTDSDKERVLLASTMSRHNLNADSNIRLYWPDGTTQDVLVRGFGDLSGNYKDYYFSIDAEDLTTNLTEGRFSRLVFNVPCKYYLRKFRRIPNFKTIGNSESSLQQIHKYSESQYEFNHDIDKLAFASTIYGDDVAQIVFTDDINLDGLTDNLGMPIKDIYLTIVKANKGHEDWYSLFAGSNERRNPQDIEWSACFGEVSSGLDLPIDLWFNEEEDRYEDIFTQDYNVRRLHNIDFNELESQFAPKSDRIDPLCFDKAPNIWLVDGNQYRVPYAIENNITFENEDYYGDLVEFSPIQIEETILHDVCHRFNTLQREYISSGFTNIITDEIYQDDYEGGSASQGGDTQSQFRCVEEIYNSYTKKNNGQMTKYTIPGNLFPEGYYYKAHYRIRIAETNDLIAQSSDTQIPLDNLVIIDGGYLTFETTMSLTNLADVVVQENKYPYNNVYNGTVISIDMLTGDTREVTIKLTDDISLDPEKNYIVFLKTKSIPSYAIRYPDNSGRYIWKTLRKNSDLAIDEEIGSRPFTNGAHYIYQNIDFFLRRQDPEGDYGLNITESVLSQWHQVGYNRLCRLVTKGKTIPEIPDNKDYNNHDIFDLC